MTTTGAALTYARDNITLFLWLREIEHNNTHTGFGRGHNPTLTFKTKRSIIQLPQLRASACIYLRTYTVYETPAIILYHGHVDSCYIFCWHDASYIIYRFYLFIKLTGCIIILHTDRVEEREFMHHINTLSY
jgi:hypothetical protein